MTDSACRVNVIIPNWNGMSWLPACLEALAQQGYKAFDVTLVDNGSTDGSDEWVSTTYPDVTVIRLDRNRGFAAAVNEGIARTRAEYVVLLNSDTKPERDWLAALVDAMDAAPADVGGLASRMVFYDQPAVIENAGDILTWYGETLKRGRGCPAAEFAQPAEVFSVCAGAALYRRRCLEEVGPFDERFFAYLEDVDFGLRARILGYRFLYVAAAKTAHHGHATGLRHTFYVRLVARNRLLLFVKNVPASLLWRHVPRLLYGQFYFLLVYRRPAAFLRGVMEALVQCPRARRHRRDLWRRAGIDRAALNALIQARGAMTPIRTVLLGKLRGSAR